MENFIANIALTFSGLLGFLVCRHIFLSRRRGEFLACPFGRTSCEAVQASAHARFLSVRLEVLGMIYFAFIFLVNSALLLLPFVTLPAIFGISALSVIIAAAAFLFALYLLFIQAVSLGEFCSWCLASLALCVFIFFYTFAFAGPALIFYLAEYRQIVTGAHLLGLALGLGGATIADVFFFRFIKNRKISYSETGVLHTLSQVIWLGLGLMVASGLGLYLPAAEALNGSGKFLAKMIVVAVIIANGLFLNLYLTPRLVRLHFSEKHLAAQSHLNYGGRIAFFSGAVSLASWYTAFALGAFHYLPFGFATLIFMYLLILLVAAVGSQLMYGRIAAA